MGCFVIVIKKLNAFVLLVLNFMQYNCGKKVTIKGHPNNRLIKKPLFCLKVIGVELKTVTAVWM